MKARTMAEKFSLRVTYYALLISIVSCWQLLFVMHEDADTLFVMNLGRYILEHGIPHVDPFTIHENLQLVAQQWLSGIFFWEVYKNFGLNGLRLTDAILGVAMILIHWRLCLIVSGGNRTLSFVISFVVGLLVMPMIVPRPQLFSTLFLLVEVFLLEKFTRTGNAKFLLPLPILSVLLVNFHASMWAMSLVVCVPFMFVKNPRHVKFLLAAMASVFICGLINPYGFDAMTYVLRSYGVSTISENVPEMLSPSAHNISGKIFYLAEALVIFTFGKFKVPWRYIFLSGGIIFMALMNTRSTMLFYLLATFPIAFAWKNFTVKKLSGGRALPTILFFMLLFINTAIAATILKDGLEKISMPLEILYCAAIIIMLYTLLVVKAETVTGLIVSGIFITTLNNGDSNVDETLTAAMKFILRSERPENISLYVGQGEGGLAGSLGIRYYIDSRSEVFIRANNGQKDILDEYLDFTLGRINYRDFFSRYKFTHIIITNNTPFIFDALSKDRNFRVIYESEHTSGYKVTRCKIFVPKEFDS